MNLEVGNIFDERQQLAESPKVYYATTMPELIGWFTLFLKKLLHANGKTRQSTPRVLEPFSDITSHKRKMKNYSIINNITCICSVCPL